MSVFRTQSDIYDGAFYENSERLKVVRESSINIRCYEDVSMQKKHKKNQTKQNKKRRNFPLQVSSVNVNKSTVEMFKNK